MSSINLCQPPYANLPSTLQIVTSYIQTLAILASIQLNWSGSAQNLFHVLSIANLNIELISLDCDVDISFYDKWAMSITIPLIFAALLLVLYTILKILKHWSRRYRIPFLRDRVLNVLINFFMFAYLFLTHSTLIYFDCHANDDGNYYFDADPSVRCYDAKWNSYLGLAVVSVIGYVLGIPLWFWIALRRMPSEFDPNSKAIFNKAREDGKDKKEKTQEGQNDTDTRVMSTSDKRWVLRYRHLVKDYRPAQRRWELVIMGQKVLLSLSLLFSDRPAVQACLAISVALATLICTCCLGWGV